jgi:ribosomal protein S6--L-glutamate ligase
MRKSIHFLLNERVHPVPNPTFVRAMALLEERGCTVTSGIPEEALLCPDRLVAEHDLYVLKSQTELALSVAGVLHDLGGRFANPYPACALAQNKITAASRLARAGVPVPRCWLTADMARLQALAAERPIIVKPYRGHRGAGVVIAQRPEDLAGIRLGELPMLVQEFIPGAGGDLKIYVVGTQVFGVRKSFSADSFRATGMPVPVSREVREIALRCGQAFGIGLYGIDIIESADGPVVVDFNHSPGFRGVPDAAPLIARHIEDLLRASADLSPTAPALHRAADRDGLLQEIAA